MWDTTTRIPFEGRLLIERSDSGGAARLLDAVRAAPGISVEELHGMRLAGLFADLRALQRDGRIRTVPAASRFFERATRVYPGALDRLPARRGAL
jgi:hypothetical protein